MARYKRICGYDLYFLTGVDEHGQKVEKELRERLQQTPLPQLAQPPMILASSRTPT